MSLALLKTAIVEQGVQRLSHSGIPTYGAQKGQPRWRYAVVGEEEGDKILRLSTGDKIMQWKLNSAEDATRIEDLADKKLEDGPVHASGAAQVHKSSPSLIHATMQDGRIGSTFSLIKQQGDNWKVHHKPGKEPLQNTALQFVQAFKEKTAALSVLKEFPQAKLTGSRGRAIHYGRAEPEGRDHDYMVFEDEPGKREAISQRLKTLAEQHKMKIIPRPNGLTISGGGKDLSVYPTSKLDQVYRAWELQEAGVPKEEAWAQVNSSKLEGLKTAALTKEQSALEKLKRHLKGFDYHVVLTTPGGDGASMHRATGESAAVRRAREAHKEWEKTQGINPDHDWAKKAELGKVMSECPVCGKIFDTGMLSDNPEKVRDKKCPKCKGESKLERTLDEKTKDMGKVAIIEKIDGEYVLWTKDRSKRLGTHKTRLGAIKQEYAIQKSQESESKLAHLLAHYSRAEHKELRPLSYDELVTDRTSGRWKDKPEMAQQYVADRRRFESALHKRLAAKNMPIDRGQSFLYSTIDGKEGFGQSGQYKHVTPLDEDTINRSFFDVVGAGKGRTTLGLKGLQLALKRWDAAKASNGLTESEYMGMKIKPRIEVITPKTIIPEKIEKLASLVTRAGQVARYMARVPQNEPFVSGVAGTAKNVFRLGYKPYMGKHTGKIHAGLQGGFLAGGGYQLYGVAKDTHGKLIDNADQVGQIGYLTANPDMINASNYMRESTNNPVKIVFPETSESFRKLPKSIQPEIKQTNRDITLISIRDALYNMGSKAKNNILSTGLNIISPTRPIQTAITNNIGKALGTPAGNQIKEKVNILLEKFMTNKPAQKTGSLNSFISKLANDSEKRFKKVITNPDTGREKTVEYGQAGKASDGGDRIRPGTSKGDAYCARSAKIKGDWASDPNSPNRLSRRKWKCRGSKSVVKSANADAAIPETTERLETAGGKASVKVRNWLNTQLKAGNKIERYTAALKNMGKKNLDPEIDNDLTQLLFESGVEDAPLSFEGQAYDDFWQDFNEAYTAPLDVAPSRVKASPSGAQKLSIFHKKAKLDSPRCKTPNLNKLADFTFDDFTSPLTDPNPIKATATAAVVGAGLGAGMHYFQKLKRILAGEEEPESEPSLLGHIGRGAAVGAGTSLAWRGVNELLGGQRQHYYDQPVKRASLNRSEIIARIMSDYSLSDRERSLLIAMVEEASQSGLSLSPATLSNAGLGALAGWIASKMGGFGGTGQLVGAGLGAGIGAMFTNPSSAEYYRGYTTY